MPDAHKTLDAPTHQNDLDTRTKPSNSSAMKKGFFTAFPVSAIAVFLSTSSVFAQDAPSTASAKITATATADSVKLPYGVEDVLKLSRAQVSEDVITTYIQNTGTIYNLRPQDIVYLKEQGVSDRIINTMMDQRRIANEVAAQAQQQQAAAQQPAVVSENNGPVSTPAYAEPEPPAPVATQPAASSLYIIPYPTPAYPRYFGPYYYPYAYSYPYSYYSTCRPVVGFRFGVGRSFHSFHHHR
jgi:hypothetical protein